MNHIRSDEMLEKWYLQTFVLVIPAVGMYCEKLRDTGFFDY